MKTLSLTVSSFATTSLSHYFSLLSAILYFKPFRKSYMYCEIFDHYFSVFFLDIQLKKENLKSLFGHPNRYTGLGLPSGLDLSLLKYRSRV